MRKMTQLDRLSTIAVVSVFLSISSLVAELIYFSMRSGAAVVFNAGWLALSAPSLMSDKFFSKTVLLVIVIGSVLCVPRKRKIVDVFALIPWILTVASMLWSAYWFVTFDGTPGQPRSSDQSWISGLLLLTLLSSTVSWIVLIVVRNGYRLRVILAACLQLYFQAAMTFLGAMAGMNSFL